MAKPRYRAAKAAASVEHAHVITESYIDDEFFPLLSDLDITDEDLTFARNILRSYSDTGYIFS